MLLRQRGITSTMAANGLEGVKAVKAALQSFDLIFMDNSMPIMVSIVICYYNFFNTFF